MGVSIFSSFSIFRLFRSFDFSIRPRVFDFFVFSIFSNFRSSVGFRFFGVFGVLDFSTFSSFRVLDFSSSPIPLLSISTFRLFDFSSFRPNVPRESSHPFLPDNASAQRLTCFVPDTSSAPQRLTRFVARRRRTARAAQRPAAGEKGVWGLPSIPIFPRLTPTSYISRHPTSYFLRLYENEQLRCEV